MGATGYTIFEDDLGADWVARFMMAPSVAGMDKVLARVAGKGYLDDRLAAAILCCAEILARAGGHAVESFPRELETWTQRASEELAQVERSGWRAAVVQVRDTSELSSMWAEVPEWISYIDALVDRLKLGKEEDESRTA